MTQIRYRYVRRQYRGTSGDWYSEWATDKHDETPTVKHSVLGCDLCFLHLSHSEALCAQERANR
jgi:hypothetical protein